MTSPSLIGAALLLHACAFAQAPQELAFPEPEGFPEGVVLDSRGRAVAGASVSLAMDPRQGGAWSRAVADRMARVPLPEAVSQADGTFVLPVLPEMRPLGGAAIGWNTPTGPLLWLIVDADGFLPWREPLWQGLAGYMGSRVVLRPDREGDPFRDVPWPPALAPMSYPWWNLDAPHPAESARRRSPDVGPLPARDVRAVTLELRDEAGRALPRAEILFSDSAYALGGSLPLRTNAEGRADLELPVGEHWLRVQSAGVTTWPQRFEVGAVSERLTLSLPTGEWVDAVAADRDGRTVPFVEVPVVSLSQGPAGGMPPFTVWSESLGRLRFNVREAEAYIVYGDEDDPVVGGHAIPLDPKAVRRTLGSGVVRVPKFRPVTAVLDVDHLVGEGEIVRRENKQKVSMQGFSGVQAGGRIATRLLCREHEAVTLVFEKRPGLELRVEELPPEPRERLLDLVQLDRRMRCRAVLELSSEGAARVRASGAQLRWRWELIQGSPFDEVEGRWLRRREGRDEIWARDAAPVELIVSASGYEPAPVEIPAQEGTLAPRIEVRLTPK